MKPMYIALVIGAFVTAITASSPVWSALGALMALSLVFAVFTVWLIGTDIKNACAAAEYKKAA